MTLLKQWMSEKNIGNNELARILQVNPSAVSQFATGSRPVTNSFRWLFAREFGIEEAEAIFGDAESRPDAQPQPVA